MMPHSVHTFLEMTSLGLLDGCSFILNAMHVLKVAPLPYDGSSAAEKAKNFAEKGLESVAFKEYNKNYPHKKYTVGFAADGSPSFYINTEDNSEIHVGDPCFGKVIEGFDTVARLEAMPTRNGIWFEKRIGIKSARLLLNE
jgi:cyclophilin family peptidyl-prolyl cis-trans isomerase